MTTITPNFYSKHQFPKTLVQRHMEDRLLILRWLAARPRKFGPYGNRIQIKKLYGRVFQLSDNAHGHKTYILNSDGSRKIFKL